MVLFFLQLPNMSTWSRTYGRIFENTANFFITRECVKYLILKTDVYIEIPRSFGAYSTKIYDTGPISVVSVLYSLSNQIILPQRTRSADDAYVPSVRFVDH